MILIMLLSPPELRSRCAEWGAVANDTTTPLLQCRIYFGTIRMQFDVVTVNFVGGTIMARPALSATRGIEILDLLAAFPTQAFTLSEIARASGINVSSCHSVLNALLVRGYLSHGASPKTYVLGPALV